MAGARSAPGLFRYLKEAFLFRWNLLLLGGAARRGDPDRATPTSRCRSSPPPRSPTSPGCRRCRASRRAIDAKARAESAARPPAAARAAARTQATARERIIDVLKSLTEDRRARFLRLRARCVEMTRIANAVRGETADASGASTELRRPRSIACSGCSCKLLLSDQAIARFLQAADETQIEHTLADLDGADREAQGRGARGRSRRRPHPALAARQRRDRRSCARRTSRKSKGNAEFVADRARSAREQDRRRSPRWRSATPIPTRCRRRIDAIADGISQTEQTIRELQNITGDDGATTSTPSILDTDLAMPAQAPHVRRVSRGDDDRDETKILAGTDGVTRGSALPAALPAVGRQARRAVLLGHDVDVRRSTATRSTSCAPAPTPTRAGSASPTSSPSSCSAAGTSSSTTISRAACAAPPARTASGCRRWSTIANKWIGDLRALPRDPTKGLAAIDLLVQKNVMADPDERIRTAIIIDHAGYVAPSGDRLDLTEQTHLVTLLNWASSRRTSSASTWRSC